MVLYIKYTSKYKINIIFQQQEIKGYLTLKNIFGNWENHYDLN